jgi:hypothetical protein
MNLFCKLGLAVLAGGAVLLGINGVENNSKSTKKWGHIFFTSLYFKKEFNVVSDTIKYYFEKSKKNTEW